MRQQKFFHQNEKRKGDRDMYGEQNKVKDGANQFQILYVYSRYLEYERKRSKQTDCLNLSNQLRFLFASFSLIA